MGGAAREEGCRRQTTTTMTTMTALLLPDKETPSDETGVCYAIWCAWWLTITDITPELECRRCCLLIIRSVLGS
uniref:Uncharacterized protein n=1 Tax=Setaria italica TaxID=4555 RepID=K3XNZ1_SETIT